MGDEALVVRRQAQSPNTSPGLCLEALERTFLAWMHMAVTLGGIMTALVGFTYNEEGSEHPFRCIGPPYVLPMEAYALSL